jgi:hypothetical protein
MIFHSSRPTYDYHGLAALSVLTSPIGVAPGPMDPVPHCRGADSGEPDLDGRLRGQPRQPD